MKEGRVGKILQSNGGTLFLDEIGDMPLMLQTRLLRVIEEREVVPLGSDQAIPVNLHVISATHRDIRQMIQDGEFREDLYYRLNGITLHLPLLRDRGDKAELIRTLLREENADRIASRSPKTRSTSSWTIPGPAISASCATRCAPPRRCAATASSGFEPAAGDSRHGFPARTRGGRQ